MMCDSHVSKWMDDDVIHVKGGTIAIFHLLKGKEDGHLQPIEWKGGCHLLRTKEHVMYSEIGKMASSHRFKGKENGQLLSFPR